MIPPVVYQEIIDAGATEPATLAIQQTDWIQVMPVTDQSLFKRLQQNLDPGEAQAIALGLELNANRLIIDERRGRNQAIGLGLQVIGILGIVLAAKQQNLIPSVKPILDDLIVNGFWMRDDLSNEVLQLAGE
jgi:uncharacterized protein